MQRLIPALRIAGIFSARAAPHRSDDVFDCGDEGTARSDELDARSVDPEQGGNRARQGEGNCHGEERISMRQVGYGPPCVDVSLIVEEASPGAVSTGKEHGPRIRPEDASVRKNEAILVQSWLRRDREHGRDGFDHTSE